MPDDFEAQADLEVLVRAKEIEKDPSRMGRAKRFAEQRKEQFSKMADSLGRPSPGFNGARRNG